MSLADVYFEDARGELLSRRVELNARKAQAE
jgi:hypothetical protein